MIRWSFRDNIQKNSKNSSMAKMVKRKMNRLRRKKEVKWFVIKSEICEGLRYNFDVSVFQQIKIRRVR